MSNGVFVFGMFTKDGPVTWEIRAPVHSLRGEPQGKGRPEPTGSGARKSEGRKVVMTPGKVGSRPVRAKAARVSRNFRREP